MSQTLYQVYEIISDYIIAFTQRYQRFGCSTFSELQHMYLDKLVQSNTPGCLVRNVADRYDFRQEQCLTQEEVEERKESSGNGWKRII